MNGLINGLHIDPCRFESSITRLRYLNDDTYRIAIATCSKLDFRIYGLLSEWLNETDCNSVGSPSLVRIQHNPRTFVVAHDEGSSTGAPCVDARTPIHLEFGCQASTDKAKFRKIRSKRFVCRLSAVTWLCLRQNIARFNPYDLRRFYLELPM